MHGKFQNSVIHTSRHRNDETGEVPQSWLSQVIITIRHNNSEGCFLQNWARILIWIIIDFIKKNYRHVIYQRDYSNYFPSKYICVHICVDLVTPESLWRHKGIAMHVTYKTMHRSTVAWFASFHFGTLLANFGFVMYQNQIIHVIIRYKHDVSCIVRSEALRGHSDTSVHSALRASCTDWSSWPLRASDLTMHDTSCLNP